VIKEVNATLNATMDVDPHGQTVAAFTLTVPTIIAVIALVCLRFWPSGLDSKEPRLIPSNIPFIGHAIGMLRHQQRYFEMLRYDYYVKIAVLRLPFISPCFGHAFRASTLYIHGQETENLSWPETEVVCVCKLYVP
jgi:hypothetical protein